MTFVNNKPQLQTEHVHKQQTNDATNSFVAITW